MAMIPSDTIQLLKDAKEAINGWRMFCEHWDECKCNSYGEGCTCGATKLNHESYLVVKRIEKVI